MFLNHFACSSPPDSAIIAYIDNEKVTVREFRHHAQIEKAQVIRFFRNGYGLEYSDGFWNHSIGDTTPLGYLKKSTLDKIYRIKLQQLAARKQGIQVDISFDNFLLALGRENERRRFIKESGGVIYGPVIYTETVYFNYLFSNMVNQLKNKLSEAEFNISESELMDYYEAMKDSLFFMGYSFELKLISISTNNKDVLPDAATKALSVFSGHKCGDWKQDSLLLRQLVEDEKRLLLNMESIVLNDSVYSGEEDNPLMDNVKELMNTNPEGYYSTIFEHKGSLYIVRVDKKYSLGFRPFAESAGVIKSALIEKCYNEYVNFLVLNSTVTVNNEVFNQLGFE